jgi:hypothetical protein
VSRHPMLSLWDVSGVELRLQSFSFLFFWFCR